MSKEKKKQGRFSKIMVIFCVLEMFFMQWWAMRIVQKQAIEVTGLISVNHGVFGGELLLLCLKRIFANKDNKKKKDSDNSEEIL